MSSRLAWDAGRPVYAAWALEFAPVNISVVMIQPHGNEHVVIGSESWMFGELGDHLAELAERYPWRITRHVLPPEREPRIWAQLFRDQRKHNFQHAPELEAAKRMLIAQRLLGRLSIDTVPRDWAPAGNNAQLVDSLNGYRVKEAPGTTDVYTLHIMSSHEQYLSRALEHYAAFEFSGGTGAAWGPAVDYSLYDRAVI